MILCVMYPMSYQFTLKTSKFSFKPFGLEIGGT